MPPDTGVADPNLDLGLGLDGDGTGTQGGQPAGTGTAEAGGGGPADVMLDIEGRQVPLSQVREWERGSMRQSDYTRKTQDLANQRRELEPWLGLRDLVTARPDLAQKINALIEAEQGSSSATPAADQARSRKQGDAAPPPDRTNGLESRLTALERREQQAHLESLAAQQADDIEDQLKTLKTRYPKMDEIEVLSFLNADPKQDLELLGKASHERQHDREQAIIKNFLAKRSAHGDVPAVTGSPAGVSVTTKPSVKLGDGSAARAAVDLLRRMTRREG